MSRSRILLLAAVSLLLPWQASFAQSAADTAGRWGLIGTWRYNCGTPPDEHDYIQVFVARNGRLYHDRDWGAGTDSSVVPMASIRPNGDLDILIVFTSLGQTRENVFRKVSDGHMVAITSRNVDNDQHTIKDGKVVGSGATVPPLTRCSVPRS